MGMDVNLSNQNGAISASNPLQVAVVSGGTGGGGGGASLADVLLTDNASVLFIARDNGTVISYVRLDTGAAYTPVAPIKVASAPGLATDAKQPTLVNGRTPVDGSGVTQPVSGTVSVSNLPATQPVSGTVGVNALPALPAGANAIGSVGVTSMPNTTKTVPVAQAITGAYSSGWCIGSTITLTGAARVNGGSGLLQSLVMQFAAAQTSAVDVFFFNSAPTGTFTDKAVPSFSAADFARVMGVAHLTDYSSAGIATIYQAQNLAIPFVSGSGVQDIYALVVARGAFTSLASGDTSFSARILQD